MESLLETIDTPTLGAVDTVNGPLPEEAETLKTDSSGKMSPPGEGPK